MSAVAQNLPPLHIVSGGDARIAEPLMAMVASLIRNGGGHPVVLHILDVGIRSVAGPAMERLARRTQGRLVLDWCEVRIEQFEALPDRPDLPRESFIRLAIPDVLAPEVRRVVWLDCDILVQSDLRGLHDTNLDGAPLAAVREFGSRTLAGMMDLGGMEGVPADLEREVGFNAGVLVLDLDAWRRERIARRVLEFSHRHARILRFAEQDGLNVLLAGRWRAVDLSWNAQMGTLRSMPRFPAERFPPEVLARRLELMEQPRLIHFCGDRPWRSGLRNRHRGRFFHALRDSGYMGQVQFQLYRARCYVRAISAYARARAEALLRRG